jgi:hypothetical protein
MTGTHDEERLLDLLTEKLERSLSPTEKAELDKLLAANPQWRRHDLAYAAAAIHQAMEPGIEDMPEDVKARLIGRVVGEATRSSNATVPAQAERTLDPTQPLREVPANVIRGPWRAKALVPWMAAAAAILIAVVGWWPRLEGAATPNGFVSRDDIAKDPKSVIVAWSQTDDVLGKTVTGDVVWSPTKQTGYMRFKGLAANDPRLAQYQLWIFDAERDDRYPVDGGVFDIAAATTNGKGETIVPIVPRVPVGKVTLFAVTLEKPGGVVVSTRERLVALGKVG